MKIKHVHPDDCKLWIFVEETVRKFAAVYRLELRDVRPVKKKESCEIHGFCSRKKVISISLRTFLDGHWDKRPELAYVIVDTIAHELAHLKYNNHKAQWHRLYINILASIAAGRTLSRIRQLSK